MLESNDYRLCFIKKVGQDAEENNIYDLYFTKFIDDVTGEGWDISPAYKYAKAPSGVYQCMVKRIECGLDLICVTDLEEEMCNHCFCLMDCCDEVVALAYEREGDKKYGRIVWNFGSAMDKIKYQLSERDITMR